MRECFEEEVTEKYDDEALAWLLFVDGCAILQYMYCATSLNNKLKELSMKNDCVAFGHQDLFCFRISFPVVSSNG